MKTLFEPPLARDTDPMTSHQAAEKMVKSGELNRQEKEVLLAIQQAAGSSKDYYNFTTKDIAKKMTKYPYHKANEICKRRFSGLFNKFKICLTGNRRDGCRVWRLL